MFTTSAKDEEKITRTWPVTIARKYSNEYQREETVKINHDKEGSTDNDNIDYDDSKEKTDTLKTMFWQNPGEVDKDDNEKNLSENAVDCIYEDDDFNFIDFLQK